MTEGRGLSAEEGTPAVLASSAFLAVLDAGRVHHRLTLDDVMPALREVELTPELIAAVTDCIHDAGIEFDAGESRVASADLDLDADAVTVTVTAAVVAGLDVPVVAVDAAAIDAA